MTAPFRSHGEEIAHALRIRDKFRNEPFGRVWMAARDGDKDAAWFLETWSWRDEPLENLSIPQLETLAAEGNADATEIVQKLNARQHDYWNPIAERTDNYGRTKTTGAW